MSYGNVENDRYMMLQRARGDTENASSMTNMMRDLMEGMGQTLQGIGGIIKALVDIIMKVVGALLSG